MFRSLVVAHDGSRRVEETLAWLQPFLGAGHSQVELYGRVDSRESSELNAEDHLLELGEELSEAGAHVRIPERDPAGLGS